MTAWAVKLAASFATTDALHAASPSVMMGTPSTLTQMAFLLFSSAIAASYSDVNICGDELYSKGIS